MGGEGRHRRLDAIGVAASLAAPRPLDAREYPPSYQCTLYLPDGSVRDASGRECVGVEYVVRWGAADRDERLRRRSSPAAPCRPWRTGCAPSDDPPPALVTMGRRRG